MNALRLYSAVGLPLASMALLLAVAGAVAAWTYWRSRGRLTWRRAVTLGALRIALLALLIACLAEPVLSYRAAPGGAMPVLFLADTSRSMSMKDTPRGRMRLEEALAAWTGGQRLADQLERRFAVEYYAFDAGVRRLDGAADLAALAPEGEMTLIAEALNGAGAQASGEGLTGLILLSDGADQSAADTLERARALDAPCYVVAVGEAATVLSGEPDVALTQVHGERFLAARAENVFNVRLAQNGFTGRAMQVSVACDGEVLGETQVGLSGPNIEASVPFTPMTQGKHEFTVTARPFDGEAVTANNTRSFAGIVGDKQVSVLYVEGTPRWEYKFLRRVLDGDPAIAFTGFVESQPGMFLRQGADTADGSIPDTAEEFDEYALVILGNLRPDALGQGRMEALRTAVFEGGASVLLLPGPLSAEGEGFAKTPLGTVLPAYPAPGVRPRLGDFSLRVTPEGLDHPVLTGLDLSEAPPLPGCFVLTGRSAGANVLAVHPYEVDGRGRPLPIVAVQQSGKGRGMTIAVDSTWRWRRDLAGRPQANSFHGQFWGQAARWLTGRREDLEEGPPFFAYASQDHYEPGEEAVLLARIQREGEDNADAAVTAAIAAPSGAVTNVTLDYVPASGGLYRAHVPLEEPGAYEAEVSGQRGEALLGRDTARFYIGEPYREFDRVAMNEQLLRDLAFQTGGGFYTPAEAGGILGDLMQTSAARARFVEHKFRRTPLVFALMVLCAGLEWFFRRRSGLL